MTVKITYQLPDNTTKIVFRLVNISDNPNEPTIVQRPKSPLFHLMKNKRQALGEIYEELRDDLLAGYIKSFEFRIID